MASSSRAAPCWCAACLLGRGRWTAGVDGCLGTAATFGGRLPAVLRACFHACSAPVLLPYWHSQYLPTAPHSNPAPPPIPQGTSRGNAKMPAIVERLRLWGINQLYVIGGNGGNAAAHAIAKECAAQGVFCNVVGVPKSIDNDIQLVGGWVGGLAAMLLCWWVCLAVAAVAEAGAGVAGGGKEAHGWQWLVQGGRPGAPGSGAPGLSLTHPMHKPCTLPTRPPTRSLTCLNPPDRPLLRL